MATRSISPIQQQRIFRRMRQFRVSYGEAFVKSSHRWQGVYVQFGATHIIYASALRCGLYIVDSRGPKHAQFRQNCKNVRASCVRNGARYDSADGVYFRGLDRVSICAQQAQILEGSGRAARTEAPPVLRAREGTVPDAPWSRH